MREQALIPSGRYLAGAVAMGGGTRAERVWPQILCRVAKDEKRGPL